MVVAGTWHYSQSSYMDEPKEKLEHYGRLDVFASQTYESSII